MRFMYIVKSAHNGPPPKRLMEEMDKLAQREVTAGRMIDSGGLLPIQMDGAVVRLTAGKLDVMDGPFAESKEVIGGYAIFDYATRDEAIAGAIEFMELHQKYGEGWEGECEMRQMMTMILPDGHLDQTCELIPAGHNPAR